MNKPVKITVSDPDTKEVFEERVIDNDYTIVCAGNRYIDSIQTHANGTHVLTIKKDKMTKDEKQENWILEALRDAKERSAALPDDIRSAALRSGNANTLHIRGETDE